MINFDVATEVAKITEAYCLLHNIPIRRRFTDAELTEATERVRQAIEDQAPLELSDLSPHARVSDL